MTEQLIQRVKNCILSDIYKTLPGTGNLEITVESHGGVEYFRQALELPEVQQALKQKKITASIRVIDPLNHVKTHVLQQLRAASSEVNVVTFQSLEQDVDLYYLALCLPEIKALIKQMKVKVKIQVVDKYGKPKPDILIVTYKDVRSGKVDI